MRFFVSCLLAAAVTGLPDRADASWVVTIPTTASGDANYSWNSKYGPYGYGAGGPTLDVGLSMGGQYGNDYTVGIMMFDLSSLAGKVVEQVTLQVNSNGFGTGYYYGSAGIGWLNTGSMVLTGDVVADGLGAPASGRPGGWTIFNTDVPGSEAAGVRTHDFTTEVLADLAAGRPYSVFVLSGSRDTGGGVGTAENGTAPALLVTLPEPGVTALLALGLTTLAARRKRRGTCG